MAARYRRVKKRPKASAAYVKQLFGDSEEQPKKPSKYGNEKTKTDDGIVHDSKKEAKRWTELRMMQQAGLIFDLRRQVPFELIPANCYERAVRYKADFVYEEKGKQVVEDTKGKRTDVFIIKRKLMYHLLNIRILET